MASRLRRTHTKALGPTALSTTIAAAWTPASGKRVRLMGITGLRESAGTPLTVIVTDGTAAASGTIGYFGVHSASGGGVTPEIDFGDAGLLGSIDAKIGFKTVSGAGTVSCQLVGREERF